MSLTDAPLYESRQVGRGWWPVFALAIALTRIDHLGGPLTLPDAAFATFLLAGLWLRRTIVFVSLAALAFATDLWATQVAGADDYCFTPAYGFLLLSYAGLFYLPRHSRSLLDLEVALRTTSLPAVSVVLRATAIAVMGFVAAFAVANLSFYGFSGRFATLTFADYVAATWHYVVPYVGYALMYVAIAYVVRITAPVHVRRTGQRPA